MKRILIATLTLTVLIGLSSCLTTLHPIFTTNDLIGDGRLNGSWKKEKDGSVTIYRKANRQELARFSETLQNNADKIYFVTVTEPQEKEETNYYGFLVKLGNNYYMDYYPAESKEGKTADSFFKAHYLPMHGIYQVDFRKDGTHEVKQMAGEYLEKLIRNKQIRIKHEEMSDGSFLITAPTEELQQYLIKYGDNPEAYDKENSSLYTKIN